jgi:hypothetical protein
MARPIEQIQRDLNKLRTVSSELGLELTTAYQSYFAVFAPTLKQQSIQACYHLATNCYPEAFLKLTYSQKSQLLKTLQRVIQNTVASLLTQLDTPGYTGEDDTETTGELTSMPVVPIDWFGAPDSLSTWQKNLEGEIAHTLTEVSYKVNLLLQQAQILPPTIPKPILEANPQVDERGGNTINVPNLLGVLIERDGANERSTLAALLQRGREMNENRRQNREENPEVDDSSIDEDSILEDVHNDADELPKILQIFSIYLRLNEIEFSDGAVLSGRKNINNLGNKIKTLRREYLHKQRELTIAEAESSWRSSWFED